MNIVVNGEHRIVPPNVTVTGLVESLGLPSRGIAVAVDRVIVPRSSWTSTVIGVGAEVDIVTAMQGG
jgi:sulfur carrier protein